MKRYCQTLELVDDERLIEQYLEAHRHVWPEVIEGQRQVGILSMEIYRHGRKLFMICDTVDTFDWDRDMARLATLPRQAEWEAYVSQFQGCDPNASSSEKWQMMERIF
jgi:L-rhamnose mutarotase